MAKYVPIKGGKFAIVDDDDYELASRFPWYILKGRRGKEYAQCVMYLGKIDNKFLYAQMYLHRLIMRPPKGSDIDHLNHNGLDNRREKLSICTHEENAQNRRAKRKRPLMQRGLYFNR